MCDHPNEGHRDGAPSGELQRRQRRRSARRFALELFAAKLVQDARGAITHDEAVRILEERVARQVPACPRRATGRREDTPAGDEQGYQHQDGDGRQLGEGESAADSREPGLGPGNDPATRPQQDGSAGAAKALLWRAVARAAAEQAHLKHFSSRRGLLYLIDRRVLVVFNNHPYASFRHLRDLELAAFRRRLAKVGIRELAFGTYPAEGPDAGYSYALVLDAHEDREELVARLYDESIEEAWARREEPAAGGQEGGRR